MTFVDMQAMALLTGCYAAGYASGWLGRKTKSIREVTAAYREARADVARIREQIALAQRAVSPTQPDPDEAA